MVASKFVLTDFRYPLTCGRAFRRNYGRVIDRHTKDLDAWLALLLAIAQAGRAAADSCACIA